MYYFAYGSNMNHQQMRKRCPSSIFIKKGFLKGYKFVYDGYSSTWQCSVANIVKTSEENDVVWGGLFEINNDNLSALDCCEGYPYSYDRKEIEVKDEEGNIYNAITYFREKKTKGELSKDYRDVVIQGAKDCNLPKEYIKNNLLK